MRGEDIAKIAFTLLGKGGHEGRAFNVTGPQALSMAEIATCIGEAIGLGYPTQAQTGRALCSI